jgi:hypothetical protein
MRTYRTSSGPVREAVYYTPKEVEDICADELRNVDLYPEGPAPVRIERFIEKRFNVTPQYVDLQDGILGYTSFSSKGVEGIFVARALIEEGSSQAERRANSTLAHEAGHGLFHAHLFAFEESSLTSLFGSDFDPAAARILCRDPRPQSSRGRYDGRWWEFHANQAIGSLLMPRPLVLEAMSDLLTRAGTFGRPTLPQAKREQATRALAEIFEVNPAVARIRIGDLFPEGETEQLTL